MQITTTRVDGKIIYGFNKIEPIMYKQPKPIIRATPHGDLFSTVNDAIRKFISNANNHPFQNCLNCKYWKFDQDLCGKYGAKPPTEIIVYSCPAYEDGEEIPF